MLNRNKVWLVMAGAGVVAVLVTTVALLWDGGASPSALAETEASAAVPSQEVDAQIDEGASEASTNEPVEVVPASKTIVTPPSNEAAPDFQGIVRWINSPPLTLQELRGKVVLVDFWTYSCINCQHTIPYLRDWHDKYADKGLVIVGVHSPEFSFEKVESNVREAVVEQQVAWPVAMDNDFTTWRAYDNRWWPHEFLIDKDGLVRYHHIGEGAYEETELHIRNLLGEAGYDVSGIPVGLQ